MPNEVGKTDGGDLAVTYGDAFFRRPDEAMPHVEDEALGALALKLRDLRRDILRTPVQERRNGDDADRDVYELHVRL